MNTDLPFLIAFVGWSKVGKTTFIEGLIPLLRAEGLRVAAIKHHGHDFEIDIPGKDTYRYRRAGAGTAIISSPRKVAVVRDVEEELSLRELVSAYAKDADIVIVEGYKNEPLPKIEVYRHDKGTEPICLKDPHLVAVITDRRIDVSVPQFALDDFIGVARFILLNLPGRTAA
jgi:molybdopterin-guanine dinucleotide biosynthesis adapter protein